MKLPLQITFRDMEHSDAVETDIRKHVEKLDQLFPNLIMACRVVVERHHQHHQQGNLFHTRIDITVPGKEFVVSRDPGQHHAHEEMHVSVRDAFDAARRQLQHHSQKIQGQVKTHQTPPHGRVVAINPEEDFGRIQTDDGREIYFHRHSVVNQGFDDLKVGDEVRFDETAGDQGPQASTVKLIGKHHLQSETP